MRRTGVRLFPFCARAGRASGAAAGGRASTVGRDGNGVLVYQGAVGESNSVSLDPGPTAGKVEITDSGFPGSITPGLGCANDVFESVAICDVGAGGMRIELGDEGDSLNVNLGSFPIVADLGDGLDTYAPARRFSASAATTPSRAATRPRRLTAARAPTR
jgi:hypothetical protein